MGCSLLSVVCLAVLIMASFLANMKANTQVTTLNTRFKLGDITVDNTDSPNTPSASADQPTTEIVTRGKSDSQDKCSFNSVNETLNIEDDKNSSVVHNCVNSTTPVSVEINASSNKSGQENELKRTYRDFPEYKHYQTLQTLRPYITTVPGFITNPLTIFIAMNIKPIRTCELYMIVLGFADLLTVITRFISRLLEDLGVTKYNIECKGLPYILTISQVYSNLIVMAWTIERFIAVMFPMKLGMWCSVRNTKLTLSFLLIFCTAFAVPYLTENKAITFWNGRTMVNVCFTAEFMRLVWNHIESVYYIYIPVIVICISNSMILYRLSSMTKARISMASNKETIDKKAQENRRMTVLLMTISATFLILHIPYIVIMVISYRYPDIIGLLLEDPHAFAKRLMYTNICITVTEFQNSMNFFFYCLSGSKFKATLMKLFCKCNAAKQTDTMQSSRTDTTKI